MTEDQWRTYCFKHSIPMDYIHPRDGNRVECLVTGVDFDAGTIKLWPIPNEEFEYDKKEFWSSYDHVVKPLNKLKVI